MQNLKKRNYPSFPSIIMIIPRSISKYVVDAAREYPVIAIMGPRQSGKTTLVRDVFAHHNYISLEDYDIRMLALNDPRRFLKDLPNSHGLIIDEIQHAPQLLSYIQTIVDEEKKRGFFIITGSQNFLVNEAITQTLPGRMAVLTLLPLSIQELAEAKLLPDRIETAVQKGFYPRIYGENATVERLYNNYIQSYLERDVREMQSVKDLSTFQHFMAMCASRTGQLLNIESFSNDSSIPQATIKAWLSTLEARYIIFLQYPCSRKRTKFPRLYFIDTGIACNLLNITSAKALQKHYLRDQLVESCIFADSIKQSNNLEQPRTNFF